MSAQPSSRSPKSRKRKPSDDAGPVRRSKRSEAPADEAQRRLRETRSPSKRVEFPPDLQKGRSASASSWNRASSPSKPSLVSPIKTAQATATVSSDDDSETYITRGKSSTSGHTGISHGMQNISIGEPGKTKPGKATTTQAAGDKHHKQTTEPRKTMGNLDSIEDFDFSKASDEDKDKLICRAILVLVQDVVAFAQSIPEIPKGSGRDVRLDIIPHQENKELVRYLGRLAIGDESGVLAWESLLGEQDTRQALIVGIVGQALKEHVLGALYFGGSESLIAELEKSQKEKADTDGFERTRDRAKIVKQAKLDGDALEEAISRTSEQLGTMLWPFMFPKFHHGPIPESMRRNEATKKKLRSLVEEAAKLNHKIREAGDVVYYWPPTFKDEEFEPARMEALNIQQMIETSPYTKDVGAHGHVRANLVKGQENRSEAIVRIVCFPGIVAYRQFGGKLAKKELEYERHRQIHPPETMKAGKHKAGKGGGDATNTGFRSKVICKSVVFLKWGKQRLLTREAGTSAHIDAVRDGKMEKYEKNYKGFLELYDLFLKEHPDLSSKAQVQAGKA